MHISAILLTGGQSQRMGTDKALLRIGDKTFLGLIASKLVALSDDVLIVGTPRTGYAQAVAPLAVRFIRDSFQNCGPLGGLHAGLTAMRHEVGVIVACDMPLINVELLRHLVMLLDMGKGEAFESSADSHRSRSRMLRPYDYDAVIPKDASGWHPLHAAYRLSCVTAIEQMIQAGDLRVQSIIKTLKVRAVEADEMAHFDPQGMSVKNLNTPDELAALKGFRTL